MIQFTLSVITFLPFLAVEQNNLRQNKKKSDHSEMNVLEPSDISREEAHNYLEENDCVFGDYVLRTSDSLGFHSWPKKGLFIHKCMNPD